MFRREDLDMSSDHPLILRGGAVATLVEGMPDAVLGDVVIRNGKIDSVVPIADTVGIAPSILAEADVVDAGGCLVLPGFIDTHRHNWQAPYRGIAADWTLDQYVSGMHRTVKPLLEPEDLYLGNLVGRLDALRSGVTTMLDWSHGMTSPEHGDAALDGLLDTPARSVFGYSPHFGLPDSTKIDKDLTLMADRFRGLKSELVTYCLALRGPQYSDIDVVEEDVALARDLGLRVTVHGGSSSWGKYRPVATMYERGLLDDRTTVVHCNALQDDEFGLMAEVGATASISPEVEMSMGFGFPATGRLLRAGIRPSLSVDNCAAMGGDLFGAMRMAVLVERAVDAERANEGRTRLTARDALEFAVTEGARALGLADRVGALAPGYAADVAILRLDDITTAPGNNPLGTAVFSGHPGIVDTVIVGGRVVVRRGHLLDVDLDDLRRKLTRSRDRVLGRLAESDSSHGRGRADGGWQPAVRKNEPTVRP